MNINKIELNSNNIAPDQDPEEKAHRSTASPEEAAERAAQLKTQGRKGCKATRINMAFTPENHEYIKLMARCSGTTMTQFTNIVIEQYRKEHTDLYEQAKEVLEQINQLSKEK